MRRTPECPDCDSIDTARSHRRPIEYLFLGFRFFRCNHCHRRFHTFLLRDIWQNTAS
jgi:transcriptional regulator NrdR family protein